MEENVERRTSHPIRSATRLVTIARELAATARALADWNRERREHARAERVDAALRSGRV